MAVRGYIFDLDGTLLNTLASLANCFNRTLSRFGYPTHPVDAYRHFIGDGLRRCAERCLPPEACDAHAIARFCEAQQADYLETWSDDVTPYEGILELIDALAQRGAKLGVLSNKDHPFTVRCIDHFFGKVPFDAVMGHTMEIPHKPDPTGARLISAQFGLPPSEIALIGDTAADIDTARRAGMVSIGALWGFRDYEELKNAGARHIISHPSEVMAITPGEN